MEERRGPIGTLAICDVAMRPDLRTAHAHDALVACFVVSGAFEQAARRSSLTMVRSMVRVSPPGASSRLHFGPAGAHCFLLELGTPNGGDLSDLSVSETAFLSDLETSRIANRARDAFYTPGEAPLVLETLALELFARARRSPAARRRPVPTWVEAAEGWIRDRYDEPLTLSDAAAELGVTPVHLSRGFKEHYGCTMGTYLKAVRVSRVQQALVSGESGTLAQIALSAGFHDQSHMTRVFRQLLGTTPARYVAGRDVGGVRLLES